MSDDPLVDAANLLHEARRQLSPDILRTIADVWVCGSAVRHGEPAEQFWLDKPWQNHVTETCA